MLPAPLQQKFFVERRAVARVKRAILEVDKNSRAKYIQEFQNAFRSYECASTYEAMYQACRRARIIWLGDYHTLWKSQAFIAELLETLARSDPPVLLGVEVFLTKNQAALEEWMHEEISEEEFLKRTRYEIEWGFSWDAFRPIFLKAKEMGVPVFAVDSEPRSDLRRIGKRDLCIATKLADLLEQFPKAKMLVAFGESHLAPKHLPGRVRALMDQRGHGRVSDVIIVQNIDALYWQREHNGQSREPVVRVATNKFCVFSATLMEKYESYRMYIERWRQLEEDERLDLTPTVYNLIDLIVNFLKIDKFKPFMSAQGVYTKSLADWYPEVHTEETADLFEEMLDRKKFTTDEIEIIQEHTRLNGSCYVPRINVIYIGRFNLIEGAEEASHFVNHACKGDLLEFANRAQRTRLDLFYMEVLKEALGYFGSKLVDPKRNPFIEDDYFNYSQGSRYEIESRTGKHYEAFMKITDFIRLHKDFELNYRKYNEVPKELVEGIQTPGSDFVLLTHELGYLLGEQLYQAFLEQRVTQKQIRALYFERFAEANAPLKKYLSLVEQLNRGTKLRNARGKRLHLPISNPQPNNR